MPHCALPWEEKRLPSLSLYVPGISYLAQLTDLSRPMRTPSPRQRSGIGADPLIVTVMILATLRSDPLFATVPAPSRHLARVGGWTGVLRGGGGLGGFNSLMRSTVPYR